MTLYVTKSEFGTQKDDCCTNLQLVSLYIMNCLFLYQFHLLSSIVISTWNEPKKATNTSKTI